MNTFLRKLFTLTFIALFIGYLIGCNFFQSNKVCLDVTAKPFEKLSDYHFFTGILNELIPTEKIVPYDLITPLFSDYAFKARFVYVPEGKSAEYDTTQVLQLPVGSCLIKNFYYPEDFNKPEGKIVDYIHRRFDSHSLRDVENVDYYFISNQNKEIIQLKVAFRVTGKQPELWNPVTGEISNVTNYYEENGRIWVDPTYSGK